MCAATELACVLYYAECAFELRDAKAAIQVSVHAPMMLSL